MVAAQGAPQSSVGVTRSKGALGERANLSWFIPHGVEGNPVSRSSTAFPGDLSASCQSVCMPLLVEEHRESGRNPCERGYGAFGRPVSKEVSDIPVLPLESLLSRCVKGALLMKQ